MNLGAGRVVVQSLTRIGSAVADGSFFANAALREAFAAPRVHLFGLCSNGGIHSATEHLLALIELARRTGARDLCVHAVTDGRDTAPGTAAVELGRIAAAMAEAGTGHFASIMGRYYAMDRDRRWDRTAKAYGAMIHAPDAPRADDYRAVLAAAAGRTAPNGVDAETDEFVLPTAVGDGAVRAGDSLICFNWRADRVRQMAHAFTDAEFAPFARPVRVPRFTGMAPYEEAQPWPSAFPALVVPEPLGSVCAAAGLGQLRLAETEKYAHVTYFFNGGREVAYPGEERVMVPSPKVATYDLRPEMAVAEVAARGAEAIDRGGYALGVINFANPDMVGHTGNLRAAVAACEAADAGLRAILDATARAGGAALVLADHGNAEVMRDPETGGPHTAHTCNPVPCLLAGRPDLALRAGGRLADVAPTLLELLGLPQPAVMDGRSLIASPRR